MDKNEIKTALRNSLLDIVYINHLKQETFKFPEGSKERMEKEALINDPEQLKMFCGLAHAMSFLCRGGFEHGNHNKHVNIFQEAKECKEKQESTLFKAFEHCKNKIIIGILKQVRSGFDLKFEDGKLKLGFGPITDMFVYFEDELKRENLSDIAKDIIETKSDVLEPYGLIVVEDNPENDFIVLNLVKHKNSSNCIS